MITTTDQSFKNNEFDIIIVGGGMVGAAVACALGNSLLKVALLEQSPPPDFAPEQPHDLRVSALSIASQKILQTIGAWEGVVAKRACPFRRLRVWETAGNTEFSSQDIEYPELGHIVENRVTQLALLERVTDFHNIELITDIKLLKVKYGKEGSLLMLENGRQLMGKVIVAADGGQSRVRQAVGIGVTSWDYQQQALVLYVETDYPQQDITWQRFVSSGPQAFLPLTGNFASLVWYNASDEVKRLIALNDTQLIDELQKNFPRCLGHINKVIGRASFPLKSQHAHIYVKQGIALVGDAAHMINPLAGQGVNIGLLDAAALAEVLIQAHRQGDDIAALSVLKRYETMRRKENLKMLLVMDAFYRVFSNDVLPVKFFRNLGLGLADRLKPAKNQVMRLAMGVQGPLPKLAKGDPLL